MKTNCEVCGFTYKSGDESRIHGHHVRPKAHGGDDTEFNKIYVCPNCHSVAHILLSKAFKSGSVELYHLYEKDYMISQIFIYIAPSISGKFRELTKVLMNKPLVKITYGKDERDINKQIDILLESGLFPDRTSAREFVVKRRTPPPKILRSKDYKR